MAQSSDSNSGEARFFLLFVGVVIATAIIAYVYNYYSRGLFITSFIFAYIVFCANVYALVPNTDGYSFSDLRWWLRIGYPSVILLLCIILLFTLHSEVKADLIEKAEQARDFADFSFGKISHAERNLSVKNFFGLIFTIITQFWCLVIFIYLIAETKYWDAVANATRWASNLSIFLIFLFIVSLMLVTS